MTGSGRRTGTDGSGDALLSVEGLTVGFRTARGYADILHAVSFAVRPGTTTSIEYEDEKGRWHAEVSSGDDRPEADVED